MTLFELIIRARIIVCKPCDRHYWRGIRNMRRRPLVFHAPVFRPATTIRMRGTAYTTTPPAVSTARRATPRGQISRAHALTMNTSEARNLTVRLQANIRRGFIIDAGSSTTSNPPGRRRIRSARPRRACTESEFDSRNHLIAVAGNPRRRPNSPWRSRTDLRMARAGPRAVDGWSLNTVK